MKLALFILIITLFLTGCSDKNNQVKTSLDLVPIEKELKPYKFKYSPIIGSRHKDARVVIDTGVILKALINTYQIGKGKLLIPSHDVYVRVKAADFIPQYSVPPSHRKRTGMITNNNNKIPFMLSNQEVDRSSFRSNESIKNYVNSVYEKDSKENEKKILDESTKFDKTIKDFIDSKILK